MDPISLDIVIQPEENIQVGVTEAPVFLTVSSISEAITSTIVNNPIVAEIAPETTVQLSETIETETTVTVMEPPLTSTTIINIGPKGDPGSGSGGGGGFDPAQAAYAIALRG